MEICTIDKLKDQPFWVIVLFTLEIRSWALVTGPTDGIGKGFAFQLARKGLNLILVGRNPDKLKDVSNSIQAKYGKTQIKTVVVDFSGDISDGIQRIRESIEGLDVGVLINNVGISYPYARFFPKWMRSTTKVTRAVLPGLQRKRGAIVNIGSGAAIVIPSDPLCCLCSHESIGCMYIDQFSRCLYVEYKKSGIDVQCQPRCTPYWPHTLLWALANSLPESVVDAWRLRFCLGIRKRATKDSRKKE
ncbi:hypothetical protein I3843_Q025300 [Carya illinoinensis]|nr:hypothetical protein I3843_Q025300 [Carya illinoinensis]